MKTIKSAMAILSVALMLTDCSKHEATPSKKELLAGNPSKSWNISYASTDAGETDVSCTAVNTYTADNAWIYNADGTFKYSNGAIQEMPNCPACQCGDLANLVGTWSLSALDTLVITVSGRVESDGSITPFTPDDLLRSKITSITATDMTITLPQNGSAKFKVK